MIPSIVYLRTAVAVGLLVTLAACQQERNNNVSVPPGRDVAPAAAKAVTDARPAQVPAADGSLPPAGAASNPTATTTADGAYTALTPAERDKAMPLAGQVNNYSSDAFAKRGDEAVPRESPNATRGDEALATPNSHPQKETK